MYSATLLDISPSSGLSSRAPPVLLSSGGNQVVKQSVIIRSTERKKPPEAAHGNDMSGPASHSGARRVEHAAWSMPHGACRMKHAA
ncbi:hypothetical protein RRG08_013473 [Elysia crispata]|uniref:Uncharacterized protein n=1 Tax=Elysia crispata TaxID=231223 RepID=A0AAE1DNH0_9GAST|nr:hypothetical protein RRG08_013473 [Elysia crispata]